MTDHPMMLEAYLEELDARLRALPISERAEIITEIKSHIIEKSERHPERLLSDILSDFGSAADMAASYLSERDVEQGGPPSNQSKDSKRSTEDDMRDFFDDLFHLKGDQLSILGGFINVDKNHVKVGKVLEVDGDKRQVRVGKRTFDLQSTLDHLQHPLNEARLSGEHEFSMDALDRIDVRFGVGKVRVVTDETLESKLRWSWRGVTKVQLEPVSVGEKSLMVDFTSFVPGTVEVVVPSGVALKVRGATGRIDLVAPDSEASVHLSTGRINIYPRPDVEYSYELDATIGEVAKMPIGDDSEGKVSIEARVKIGQIAIRELAEAFARQEAAGEPAQTDAGAVETDAAGEASIHKSEADA